MGKIIIMTKHKTTLQYEFKSVRLLDSFLLPTNTNVSIDILSDMSDESLDIVEIFDLWFEEVMENSVMISYFNDYGNSLIDFNNQTPNNILFGFWDTPIDTVVGVSIFNKLKSFCDNSIEIELLTIESDFDNCKHYIDGNMEIPNIIDLFDGKIYHEKEWWHRPDGSTFDLIIGDDDEFIDEPFIGSSVIKQPSVKVIKRNFKKK